MSLCSCSCALHLQFANLDDLQQQLVLLLLLLLLLLRLTCQKRCGSEYMWQFVDFVCSSFANTVDYLPYSANRCVEPKIVLSIHPRWLRTHLDSALTSQFALRTALVSRQKHNRS